MWSAQLSIGTLPDGKPKETLNAVNAQVALHHPPFDPRPRTGSCIRAPGSAPDLYVFFDFDALEFAEA
jgi:hypothetical protein